MKNSSTCVKCNFPKIIRIGGGNKWKGYHAAFQLGPMNMIPMERYICVRCGYTELWIQNEEDLEKLEQKFDAKDFEEYV